MFGDSVEKVRDLEKKVYELTKQLEYAQREFEIKVEEKVAEVKRDVQEKLIQSDLERNEAKAKLEVYEKMDTKADANVIKSLLSQLVTALGQKTDVKIVK